MTRAEKVENLIRVAKVAQAFAGDVTVGQVVNLGEEAIEACNLDFWCVHEGLADDESVGLDSVLSKAIRAVEEDLNWTSVEVIG